MSNDDFQKKIAEQRKQSEEREERAKEYAEMTGENVPDAYIDGVVYAMERIDLKTRKNPKEIIQHWKVVRDFYKKAEQLLSWYDLDLVVYASRKKNNGEEISVSEAVVLDAADYKRRVNGAIEKCVDQLMADLKAIMAEKKSLVNK